jgi:hypothetical protein
VADDYPDRLSESFNNSAHLHVRSNIVQLVHGEELILDFGQLTFDLQMLVIVQDKALLLIVQCRLVSEYLLYLLKVAPQVGLNELLNLRPGDKSFSRRDEVDTPFSKDF